MSRFRQLVPALRLYGVNYAIRRNNTQKLCATTYLDFPEFEIVFTNLACCHK